VKKISLAATVLAATALVATTATSAQAAPKPGPWSPWMPVPKAKPFVAKGYCSVPVRIEDYRDAEVQRARTIVGGTEIEVKGKFAVRLTPFTGSHKHYIFDASGASQGSHSQIAYDNGDFLYRATGTNFFGFTKTERMNNGLPPLALTHGAESILYIAGGKKPTRVDVVDRPAQIVNVCKVMNVNPA
jgi:hypothetical protein